MPDFNPWIDAAIIACLWVPMAVYVIVASRKKKTRVSGAVRVTQ